MTNFTIVISVANTLHSSLAYLQRSTTDDIDPTDAQRDRLCAAKHLVRMAELLLMYECHSQMGADERLDWTAARDISDDNMQEWETH